MTCILCLPNQSPIYYTAIYASNLFEDHVDLWAELLHLHASLDLDSKNWILGGDLNQIMFPNEHSSPHVVVPDGLMYQLQDCFLQAGLFDLRFFGTMSYLDKKKCPTSPTAKKLDRLMVNSALITTFSHATATFLPSPPLFSDHSPCLRNLAFSLPRTGTYPFKFQNYLTKHPNFAHLIQTAWLQTGNMLEAETN